MRATWRRCAPTGSWLLPAMVYKRRCRAKRSPTSGPSRAATRAADHLLQQPARLRGRHHAGDVRRARGRRRTSWRSRNPRATCAASPICATSRAIATCSSAASMTWCSRACCSARPAGSRAWVSRSRRRISTSGISPTAGDYAAARRSVRVVHAAPAPRHTDQVRAVHQARDPGSGPGRRMGARAAPAAGRRGTRARPRHHPSRPRDTAEDSRTPARAMSVQRIRVHRLAHGRRADARGDRRRPASAAARSPSSCSSFGESARRVPLRSRQ